MNWSSIILIALSSSIFILVDCRHVHVRTSRGLLRGRMVEAANGLKVRVFQGVPYARPPVDKLRYAMPQDIDRWHGILDATEYRSACMSNTTHTTSPQDNISEDCLYLNVFADDRCGDRSDICPVIFYIHGGGFSFDAATMFPVQTLVDNFGSQRLIFITAAYRLGSFGFLDFGDDSVVHRNIAFYDQMQGLQWVQREIAAFGGDPNRVTIMGHSAGSVSVALLTLSPKMSNNYFHQAIAMSGAPSITINTNVKPTQLLALRTNCTTHKQWSASNYAAIVDCLRMKSSMELITAQRELEDEYGISFFGPSIDGPNGFFPGTVEQLMKTRQPRPYMTGTTSNEFNFPLNLPKNITTSESAKREACKTVENTIYHDERKSVIDACIRHYNEVNPDIDFRIITQETIFVQTFTDAREMRNSGGSVYLYSFEYEKRSRHAQDLTFVMGIHPFEYDDDDRVIASIYPRYFAQFAHSSRPHPDWQPMQTTADGCNYYLINYQHANNKSGSVEIHPHNEQCYHEETIKFWLNEVKMLEEENATTDILSTTTDMVTKPTKLQSKTTTINRSTPMISPTQMAPIAPHMLAAAMVPQANDINVEPRDTSSSKGWPIAFGVAASACAILIVVLIVVFVRLHPNNRRRSHEHQSIADEQTALLSSSLQPMSLMQHKSRQSIDERNQIF